jgi:hypothetical protein
MLNVELSRYIGIYLKHRGARGSPPESLSTSTSSSTSTIVQGARLRNLYRPRHRLKGLTPRIFVYLDIASRGLTQESLHSRLGHQSRHRPHQPQVSHSIGLRGSTRLLQLHMDFLSRTLGKRGRVYSRTSPS